MTDEEHERNRAANEIIWNCEHEPIRVDGTRGVICTRCGCRFMAVLLPMRWEPLPVGSCEDDD